MLSHCSAWTNMTCRLTPLMLGYYFNDLPASFDSVLYHFGFILSFMDCLDMSATYPFGRAHLAFFSWVSKMVDVFFRNFPLFLSWHVVDGRLHWERYAQIMVCRTFWSPDAANSIWLCSGHRRTSAATWRRPETPPSLSTDSKAGPSWALTHYPVPDHLLLQTEISLGCPPGFGQ